MMRLIYSGLSWFALARIDRLRAKLSRWEIRQRRWQGKAFDD